MSRKRYISTDLSLSGKVEELARRAGEYGVILWTWLIPHLDDWGRMEGEPDKVFFSVTPRFALLGRTPQDAEVALQAMNDLGLITWYEVDGSRYIQANLDTFYSLQTYIPKDKRDECKSAYPAPPAHVSAVRHLVAQNSAECYSALASVPSPSPSPSPTEINTSPNGDDGCAVPAGADSPAGKTDQDTAEDNPQEPERKVRHYSPEAKAVADRLKADLEQRGAVLPRDWHLKAYAAAQRMLNAGITPEEIDAAREAAWSDPWWSQRLDSMATLQKLVNQRRLGKANLKPRDKPPARASPFTDERMSAWYREAFERNDQQLRAGEGNGRAGGSGGGTGGAGSSPVQPAHTG